jgi:hypothetical protein
MKRILLFLLILSLTLPAQDTERDDETLPVSIHLELGKDTLALAEPTCLKVSISNHSGKELLVDSRVKFNLYTPPVGLSLTLIFPDGKESVFSEGGSVHVSYGLDAKLYAALASGETVSTCMILWWTNLLPQEFRRALETLPPGTYKLFATYRLPQPEALEGGKLYSDTIEFVFLPLEEQHLPILIDMDSLGCGGSGNVRREERLPRIGNSKTPYSEAAYATSLIAISSYDSFVVEKARFDKLYPQSQFVSVLLHEQFVTAKLSRQASALDSLKETLRSVSPTHMIVLPTEKLRRGISIQEARSK